MQKISVAVAGVMVFPGTPAGFRNFYLQASDFLLYKKW